MGKFFIRLMAGAALLSAASVAARAELTLNNAVTGEALNLDDSGPDGKDTEAFKTFIKTGRNIYVGDQNCLAKGEQTYLAMCSGCHGQKAEGKLGPGLNDTHWTYPQGRTDKGLFEIIYGGAQGMMGPMHGAMNVDEMLLTMAWVRHLYKGGPEEAGEWLTAELKDKVKPYSGEPAPKPAADAPESCKIQ